MKLKVKDLGYPFGFSCLKQYCRPEDVASFRDLCIEQRSSRLYYFYARKYGDRTPIAYFRVYPNEDIFSIVKRVL